MISMEPVLKRGYTAWDRDVLPADEFAERLAAVRARMREQALDALVVVNYSLLGAMFEYADIAYLAGLQSGGVLVVFDDADPVLVSFGGGRELFFMKEQTWTSVVPGRGRTFELAAELIAERNPARKSIGTVGLRGMPAKAVERLRTAFEGCELTAFDETLAALRIAKRPRELLAIGIAKGIADDAAAAAASAFAAGADNVAAMIEAERVARFRKARDVRVLVNMNARELRPFEGRLAGRHAPLLLWVAAQYQGYWAETALMSDANGDSAAAACVDAMHEAVHAGARAEDIAAAGIAALPAACVDGALQYGLGNTVGLAQNEGIEIRPNNTTPIPEGAVLSLVTFAVDGAGASIASRMLSVGSDGTNAIAAVRGD